MIASRSFKAVLICHLIVHATQAPLPGKLRYPPKQFKTGQTSSDLFGQRRMFAESHCTLRWVEMNHVFFSKAEGGASYIFLSVQCLLTFQTIDQSILPLESLKERDVKWFLKNEATQWQTPALGFPTHPLSTNKDLYPLRKKSLTKQRCFQENNCLCM